MDKGFVVRAASLLMIVQILSRVLGFARDSVLMNLVGMGHQSDAFNAAFSIPDFLYNVLIGGAISSAFIPVFSSYMARNEKEEAWKVSSIFTSWALLLLFVGCVVAFIFTEPLLSMITKFDSTQMALPILLTRITLLQALFMAMSAIATGILQSHQHFTWPAIGILVYNVCILLGGILLIEPIEKMAPGYGVAGFSIGVVVGAAGTLIIQIPTLRQVGYRYRFALDPRHPGLHQLLKLILPVLIGLSVSQINLLVTQYLATDMEGVLTALRTANRFIQLPIGVFATSICVAMFPTMTAQAAIAEMDEMKKSLSFGIRNISFIIMPCMVGLAMLAEPIIRLLYEFSDKFTHADTIICSEALVYYSIGIIGYAVVQALIRAFYALQNTATPVAVSIIAIAVNIGLSFLLVGPLAHKGLALAYSISGLVQCLLLFLILRRKIGHMDLRHIGVTLVKTLIACAVMAAFIWLTADLTELWFGLETKTGQMIQVAGCIGVAVVVFFAASTLMKMEEVNMVLESFKRKLSRKR